MAFGNTQGPYGSGQMNYTQPTQGTMSNTFPNQTAHYPEVGYTIPSRFQSIASQYPSQPTQPMQRPSVKLYCKMVNNPDEITVNEIPMDGISLFMSQDLSCIYAKQWNGNGNIDTIVYQLPEPKEPIKNQTDDFRQIVLDRFDKIENLIASKFNNNYKHKNNQNAGQTPTNDVGGDQK